MKYPPKEGDQVSRSINNCFFGQVVEVNLAQETLTAEFVSTDCFLKGLPGERIQMTFAEIAGIRWTSSRSKKGESPCF